jgi:sugar lactone lactonase YvrE
MSPPMEGGRIFRSARVVLLDAFAPAIRRITPRGIVETLYEGAPLMKPKDVAPDGTYVIADLHCCIYRLTRAGTLTVVARGVPLVAPQDIEVDRDGTYVVTDIGLVMDPVTGRADADASHHPGKLLRVTRDGEVSVIDVVRGARFRGVNLDAKGNYLVVDILFRPSGIVVAR